jgi:hypothetical protein
MLHDQDSREKIEDPGLGPRCLQPSRQEVIGRKQENDHGRLAEIHDVSNRLIPKVFVPIKHLSSENDDRRIVEFTHLPRQILLRVRLSDGGFRAALHVRIFVRIIFLVLLQSQLLNLSPWSWAEDQCVVIQAQLLEPLNYDVELGYAVPAGTDIEYFYRRFALEWTRLGVSVRFLSARSSSI